MASKQPTRHEHIDTHFRPEDMELYQFVKSQVNGWGDTSQIMRRFVEIAMVFNGLLETANNANEISRLFAGSLTEAQAARQALDEKRGILVTVDSLAIKLTQAVDRHSDEIGEVE